MKIIDRDVDVANVELDAVEIDHVTGGAGTGTTVPTGPFSSCGSKAPGYGEGSRPW